VEHGDTAYMGKNEISSMGLNTVLDRATVQAASAAPPAS